MAAKTKSKDKCHTVWLKPRHQAMIAEMPGVKIGELTRKAIEEYFESRNDRDYALLYMEEDLSDLKAEWERRLGLVVSHAVTSIEEGFRIVLVANKKYADTRAEVDLAPKKVELDDGFLDDDFEGDN